MFLEYVEVYALVDHHRNNAPVGIRVSFAFCWHSLECPPGALDIAGAVDVGTGEVPGGQRKMWIES